MSDQNELWLDIDTKCPDTELLMYLSVVKDRVRLAGAKNTTLLNISGTVIHIVSILANVIALSEVYQHK